MGGVTLEQAAKREPMNMGKKVIMLPTGLLNLINSIKGVNLGDNIVLGEED